jgi:hypothetical protein
MPSWDILAGERFWLSRKRKLGIETWWEIDADGKLVIVEDKLHSAAKRSDPSLTTLVGSALTKTDLARFCDKFCAPQLHSRHKTDW